MNSSQVNTPVFDNNFLTNGWDIGYDLPIIGEKLSRWRRVYLKPKIIKMAAKSWDDKKNHQIAKIFYTGVCFMRI